MDRPATEYAPIPWRHSLIFRVIVLCAVLVFCLLGSVYVITRHYFGEVVQEMETQAEEMASIVVQHLEEHPDADLNAIADDMHQIYGDTEIELEPKADTVEIIPFTLEHGEGGKLTKVARLLITGGDQQVVFTARVTVAPQTEIVRAFKNTYLLALTFVFVVTLGLMVYFIARMLRPLTELSESCAQIKGGTLQDVTTRRNTGEILALEQTFNEMVRSLREKESIERKLRQAQRLSALGNLAAGVAHDVRNPLNAIKLLSSHTVDTLNGVPEAAGSIKQLKTIRNEVNRLEDIVSAFLSLAKERELKLETARIDPLLEECTRLIRKDAEKRGIRLTAELRAGDVPLMIDSQQLKRAFLNVLINAMEACPKEGRVRLFSRVTDHSCEVEVRDDGPGMDPDVAERAFDPYFTTKEAGTGLGLSTTRAIVEEHGGSVSLSSVEGRGCQVLITLPLETDRV